MIFYKNIIRSFVDMPDYLSMIVHSLEGCNFNCFGCFNKKLFEQTDCYSVEELLSFIELSGYLFDCIILSGGEFLLSDIDDIERFLNEVKQIFTGKIIIYSNGSLPDKIAELYSQNIIDGVHLDIKLPYHVLDIEQDHDLIKDVLGIEIDEQIRQNLLQSIDLVIKHNGKFDRLRTVKYPILDDQFFEEIKNYVNIQNKKYNSNVQWNLNEFIKGE